MVQSLEKALALLNAVAAHGDWIGVRELSRVTGLKPPTAQQLLKTLQAANYLDFDETSRRYRIGIAALMLGHGSDAKARLGEFAKPFVDEIFEEFGETTVALACERSVYFNVYSRHCEKALATSIPSQRDIENPHLMACGQALLAWQGKDAIASYVKAKGLNGGTAGVLALLGKVRECGYSELIDFNSSSVAAYGVPVFDVTGKLALSLGWSVPLARFDESLKERALSRLLSISAQMGASLGYKPATAGRANATE